MKEKIDIKKALSPCMERQPAYCSLRCPFHMDVINFLEKLQRKSFDAAFRVFRDACAFPGIVSVLCDEACKAACPRKDKDGAVEMGALERASLNYTGNKEPRDYNIPAKAEKVAVIGGGISGLACALRLASKKYSVTVFEREDETGGQLKKLLPREVYRSDIDLQFRYETVDWKLGTEVSGLGKISGNYEAIYIATGKGGFEFGLKPKENGKRYAVTNQAGIFSGGSLLGWDAVNSIAGGLEAATVIEGYLMTKTPGDPYFNKCMTAEYEPYVGEASGPVKAASEDGMYSKEEAVQEASRCVKCCCNACVRSCDLMQYYKKSALKMADDVRATSETEGVRCDITVATKLMAACNQCGSCTHACPKDIDFEKIILQGRRALYQKNAFPWAYHEFFLRDMAFSNSKACRMAYSPQATGAKSRYLFFPGCQLGASDPRYVTESYQLLLEHYPDTSLLVGCCGAPAVWSGNEELQEEVFHSFREEWNQKGKPVLIFACANCRKTFKEYLPKMEGIFLYDLLGDFQKEPKMNLAGKTCTVFDPCAARYEEGVQHSIRDLLNRTGCRQEVAAEEREDARCCGFGGHVYAANPEYARRVAVKRLEAKKEDAVYVTYCVNCRDIFADQGGKALHILDVYFGLNNEDRPAPTVSRRRENRLLLKQELEEWLIGKKHENPASESSLQVKISEPLRQQLSRELILEKDIEEIIRFCEETEQKVQDKDTGHFFGHKEVGCMTFWVEYTAEDGKITLVDAYAHRIKILEGRK